MAQLLQDDDSDTSDASSLYDEIDPSALAQLAAGNASAREQFLALLDRGAEAERDAAAAQDAIAAMASCAWAAWRSASAQRSRSARNCVRADALPAASCARADGSISS